jgi:hypothetical protein
MNYHNAHNSFRTVNSLTLQQQQQQKILDTVNAELQSYDKQMTEYLRNQYSIEDLLRDNQKIIKSEISKRMSAAMPPKQDPYVEPVDSDSDDGTDGIGAKFSQMPRMFVHLSSKQG